MKNIVLHIVLLGTGIVTVASERPYFKCSTPYSPLGKSTNSEGSVGYASSVSPETPLKQPGHSSFGEDCDQGKNKLKQHLLGEFSDLKSYLQANARKAQQKKALDKKIAAEALADFHSEEFQRYIKRKS